MSPLAAALQLLLISPALIRRPFTARELGASIAYFPLVGMLLGALLAGADGLLSQVFPTAVGSALILALWIVLTGALHFDGFLDACDGLLGGDTPERRLEIMRDERTGAYAAAGGALLLLTMFSALAATEQARWAVLLLAPALGRGGAALSVVTFPYARETGLGRDIKDHSRPLYAAAALLTSLTLTGWLSWQLRSLTPAIALVAAAIVWWLTCAFITKRIPGMTGDTYGAVSILIEASVLLTFAAAL